MKEGSDTNRHPFLRCCWVKATLETADLFQMFSGIIALVDSIWDIKGESSNVIGEMKWTQDHFRYVYLMQGYFLDLCILWRLLACVSWKRKEFCKKKPKKNRKGTNSQSSRRKEPCAVCQRRAVRILGASSVLLENRIPRPTLYLISFVTRFLTKSALCGG